MNTRKKTILLITVLSVLQILALGYYLLSKKETMRMINHLNHTMRMSNYLDHTMQMDALSYGVLAAKKTVPWEEISISALKNGEFIKPFIAENFKYSKLDSRGDKWMVLTIQNNDIYHKDYCQWLMKHQYDVLNSEVALQLCGDGNVQLFFSKLIEKPNNSPEDTGAI